VGAANTRNSIGSAFMNGTLLPLNQLEVT
jgi:hypothetical protein